MKFPKDPFSLLESLPYCPEETNLVFVGEGEYCEKIKQKAVEMGVENRVHILGNRPDVPQILKGCHIGVLSTKFDGFGLVAAEYMAAGLPVVVTDVEGLRDVVDDQTSLFAYKDSKTLGKKISRLLTDEDYYNKKQEYSIGRAKLFSSNEMNKKYLEVYNEIKSKKS